MAIKTLSRPSNRFQTPQLGVRCRSTSSFGNYSERRFLIASPYELLRLCTGQRFCTAHLTDVLLGSESERLRQLGHERLSTWGVGAAKLERYGDAFPAVIAGEGAAGG